MGLREWAEEKVDRVRTKAQDRYEGRKVEQSRRAVISRKAKEEKNTERYQKGEISERLYKERQGRYAKEYEVERMTPSERATQVTERIVTGSAKAVASFNQDLENSAGGSSRKSGRRKRSGSSRGNSGSGFGAVDFGELGGFGGGGGALDFGSLSGMFDSPTQRAPRKRKRS